MQKKEFRKYLENKELSIVTITNYIHLVERFFSIIKKETIQITKPDILAYLEYLKNNRIQQNKTRSIHLTAINHYFTFLYKNEQIKENPCSLLKIRGTKRKTLYNIYTPEELDVLCDNYYELFVRSFDDKHYKTNKQRKQSALSRERNAAILSILTNQGVITSEISKIEIEDLDLRKATIKIRSAKNHNERTIPLKASQIGILMYYLQNTRPQILELQATDTNKLFLTIPHISPKITLKDTFKKTCDNLTKQIKSFDKKFLNFQQVRASIITFWLKTQGLRKAQYLAGHKHVTSTEEYLPNNLENLTEDINKLHPFL